MSEQNELALVLSRIQALSNAKAHAAAPASVVDDGIPVLTDVYQGQDAFAAVELEQLFASSDLASSLAASKEKPAQQSGADAAAMHAAPEVKQQFEEKFEQQSELPAEPESEHSLAPLLADSSIRFLPVDDGNPTPENLEAPAREELVAAVLADIQPVMSDVIRQALLREVQVLGPRLSAELEAALSESVRLRVQDALKDEEPGKD